MTPKRLRAIGFVIGSILFSALPVIALVANIGVNYPAYKVDSALVGISILFFFVPFILGIISHKLMRDSEEEDPLAAESWKKKKDGGHG